ncbi:hypothetical protein amrb99_35350 [Actinomadura sp. RB99]|nr:hypothetical protein [Actinomadura sp. RB99]
MTAGPRPTWVNPGLLRASCLVADEADEAASPWLRRGTHLRVFPSPLIGYPVCPFTVWRAGTANWTRPVLNGAGDFWSTGTGDRALFVGGWGPGGPLSVLDADGRTSERCTRPRAFVARVPLPGLRYGGSADLVPAAYVSGLRVDDHTGEVFYPGWLDSEPLDAIGAQLPEGAWWSGIDGRFASADPAYRVGAGVPDTPMPYDALQPADAYGRAKAAAAALEPDVARAWSAPATGTPPVAARFTRPLPGNQGATAEADLTVGLWAASADPACARWWGFATTLPVEASAGAEYVECFAVAALFALHPGDRNERHLKIAANAQSDPMAPALTESLYRVHERQDLKSRAAELMRAGREVVCLWTIAVAAPPPDPPDAPWADVPGDRRTSNDDTTWTATLNVFGAGAGPLAARRDPDVPLNELVNTDEAWRQPIIAPRTARDAVAVTDGGCPPEPATWRIAAADMWGQWSEFGVTSSDAPDPPDMRAPAVALELIAADPLPGGDAPAVPGTLSIRVALPEPPAAVPPITAVEAELTGAASPVVLTPHAAGLWTGETAAAPTTPGGSVTVTCTVTAADAIGRTTTGTASFVAHDPRPFVSRAHAGVVLFSGERRPDGFAELDLTTPLPPGAPAGVTWRLYVTDEQLLSPPPARDEPRWSRAAWLRTIVDAAATRAHMAQLAGASVTAQGGDLRVRCRLPGRLESVQAMQLVATTATGLEAPSKACGAFVVAVPLGDTPPAPTLTRHSDDDATVSLTVSVSYPGTRPVGDAPPAPIIRRSGTKDTEVRARIRRSAAGADPSAWPVLTTIGLRPDHPADRAAGWRWTAVFDDALSEATPAWTPLSYVCEVAWPDEPAWNPSATPDFGVVRPTWSPAAVAQPSAWSAPSATLTVIAPRPTVVIRPGFTDNGDGTAALIVPVPTVHPRARPWTLTATAPGRPLATVTGPGPELRLDGLDARVPAAHWLLAVVPPDGTILPMITGDGAIPLSNPAHPSDP